VDVTKKLKRMFEISLIFISVSMTLLLSNIVASSYEQAPSATTNTPPQETLPEVKITSIEDGDSVPVLGNLTISGTSSDDASSTCQVSVIANDVKPYQPAIATGSGGPADYSDWKFTITSNYTSIKEGENEITSKVVCPGNGAELTKWYGVNVTGVSGTGSVNANSSEQGDESGSPKSSAQSSGPVYSYSKQQNATNKTLESGNNQNSIDDESEQESELSSGESTTTPGNTSNNSRGVSTNFVPPFSP
jgi:hypothetical protein